MDLAVCSIQKQSILLWTKSAFPLYYMDKLGKAEPSWKLREEGGTLDRYFTRKGVDYEQQLDCCESTNYRMCWETRSYSMVGQINHLANCQNEAVTKAYFFLMKS